MESFEQNAGTSNMEMNNSISDEPFNIKQEEYLQRSQNDSQLTDNIAKDDRKLFVGGLSWETGEPQLKEYFGKYGEVEAVSLKLNAETGKSRCFAFIIYKESTSIAKVFEQTEHAINSKKVDVKRAKAKPGKIFIGGLKPDMTEEMIKAAFEAYGTVTEIELPVDKKDNNKRKGFGFITFEREETMKEVAKKGKVEVGEHSVDIRKATPKPGPGMGGRPGGYGGGMGFGDAYAGYGDFYGGYGGYGYGGYGGYGDYSQQGWAGYGQQGWGGYGMAQGGGGGKMTRGGAANGAAKRGGKPY